MQRALIVIFTALVLSIPVGSHAGTAPSAKWERLYEQSEATYINGDPDRAFAVAQQALQEAERAKGITSAAVAKCLRNLGEIQQGRGKAREAEDYYKRALAMYEKALGAEHLEVADTLDRLAYLYDWGRAMENGPLYTRALAIREKALGQDHLKVALTLADLAQFHAVQMKNYPQAEPLFQRVLAIWEKHFGRDADEIVQPIQDLAEVYVAQGVYAKALPLYERALKIREKTQGPQSSLVAASLEKLVAVYRKTGRSADADTLERRLAQFPQ